MRRLTGAAAFVACVLCFLTTLHAEEATEGTDVLAYIGTYAKADEPGIHICRLDHKSGKLTRVAGVSGVQNPSFLTVHPNQKTLYAVSESQKFAGQASGSVSAFAIDRTNGTLTFINEQSSVGEGPCHLAVAPNGKHLVVANYGGGSVTALPISSSGGLGPATDHIQHRGSSVNPRRQKGPHAHCVNFDANGTYVVSCDLGLDKILIYQFDDERGRLIENPAMPFIKTVPGSGPRHFAFYPNGRLAFAINELNSTVTAYQYDSLKGTLKTLEALSTLPPEFAGQNSTAEIAVSPDGKFLYGSNRGHNSIVTFSIDSEAGTLTYVANYSTVGKTPRNFAIDPTGTCLLAANQDSDNIVVFRRDPVDGSLNPTEHAIDIPKPVCITFVPFGSN